MCEQNKINLIQSFNLKYISCSILDVVPLQPITQQFQCFHKNLFRSFTNRINFCKCIYDINSTFPHFGGPLHQSLFGTFTFGFSFHNLLLCFTQSFFQICNLFFNPKKLLKKVQTKDISNNKTRECIANDKKS